MINKFNLNYYETMEIANEYLDVLEDNMTTLKNELKDNPEELNNILTLMQTDVETILELNDKLHFHLEQNEYQEVCNQLIINDMFNILIKDAIPDKDLGYLSDYLNEMDEEKLIDYVSRFIDRYNN
jgi:dGTP triphosphohydrolase